MCTWIERAGWARCGWRGLVLGCALLFSGAVLSANHAAPRWGAIAAAQQWYGYAFDASTREVAEQLALTQCQRVAKPGVSCTVRIAFNRQCGALAFGNFGEWGAANAATRELAEQASVQRCNQHLPTEPCKVAAQVCTTPP